MQTLIRRLHNNRCIVSCTTMTSQLRSLNQIQIPADTNYHVLVPLASPSDSQGWAFVIQLLQWPGLKNKVVDVTLPLQLGDGGVQQARVIVWRKGVIGIRVPVKEKGNRGRVVEFALPESVRKITGATSCPLGEFYIRFQNTKVAPLFESEIATELLMQYHCYGCQIFSITDNLSQDHKRLQHNTIQKIKNFCRSRKRLALYCSSLGSPSPRLLFTGRSFIAQQDTLLDQSDLMIYEPSELLSASVDLTGIKQRAAYCDMEVEGDKVDIHCVDCAYEFRTEAVVKVRGAKGLRPLEPIVLRETPKYFTWFVFKKYNRMTPFIVSSVLSAHNLTLVHLLDRIATEISSKQLAVFGEGAVTGANANASAAALTYGQVLSRMLKVCDYTVNGEYENKRYDVLCRVRKGLQPNNFISCKADTPQQLTNLYSKIICQSASPVCFYSDNQLQISAICHAISKHTQTPTAPTPTVLLFRDYVKELNCTRYFNFKQTYMLEANLEHPQAVEARVANIIAESEGKLGKFWARMQLEFSEEEFRSLDGRLLPALVRRNAHNDQLTDYYLRTTAEERAVDQARLRLRRSNRPELSKPEPPSSSTSLLPSMQQKLQKVQQIKSTKYTTCHLCQQPFPPGLGTTCQCSSFHCLDCMRDPSPNSLRQSCAVCKNTCPCRPCKTQRQKLLRELLVTDCHSCISPDQKLLIVCEKVTCKKGFCRDCFRKYSGQSVFLLQGQHVNVLASKNWQCFSCQGICGCLRCRHGGKVGGEDEKSRMMIAEVLARPPPSKEAVLGKYMAGEQQQPFMNLGGDETSGGITALTSPARLQESKSIEEKYPTLKQTQVTPSTNDKGSFKGTGSFVTKPAQNKKQDPRKAPNRIAYPRRSDSPTNQSNKSRSGSRQRNNKAPSPSPPPAPPDDAPLWGATATTTTTQPQPLPTKPHQQPTTSTTPQPDTSHQGLLFPVKRKTDKDYEY